MNVLCALLQTPLVLCLYCITSGLFCQVLCNEIVSMEVEILPRPHSFPGNPQIVFANAKNSAFAELLFVAHILDNKFSKIFRFLIVQPVSFHFKPTA